jgi:curved DNA-binding protein CbpA
MAEKTLYDILELSETASAEVIRAAYERLSVLWDPDGPRGRTEPDDCKNRETLRYIEAQKIPCARR